MTQSNDASGESKIIFPGESESYTPGVNGQRPKCANEDDFCESAAGYPLLVVMLTSTVHHHSLNVKLIQI